MVAASPHIVVLSGAGLSVASGIPTFRGPGGLWEGRTLSEIATPEAWRADPVAVQRFYDARRRHVESARPNAAHQALAQLQRALGVPRVTLITQNVDGLLQQAGASRVIEMHGSLRRLRCEDDPKHPRVSVAGEQPPEGMCPVCFAALRPDVVWFGEVPHGLPEIERAVHGATLFVSVGTSGQVYPAAGLGAVAAAGGAHTVEVNPAPSEAHWIAERIAEPAEVAMPRLVSEWTARFA